MMDDGTKSPNATQSTVEDSSDRLKVKLKTNEDEVKAKKICLATQLEEDSIHLELEFLRGKVTRLEEDEDERCKLAERQKKAIKQLEHEHESMRKKLFSIAKSHIELELSNLRLKYEEQIEKLQEEILHLKEQENLMQVTAKDSDDQRSRSQETIDALRKNLQNVSSERKEMEKFVEKLTEECKTLRHQVKEMQEKLFASNKSCSILKAEQESLVNINKRLTQHSQWLKKQKDEVAIQNKELDLKYQNALTQMKHQEESMNETVKNLTDRLDSTEKELEEKISRVKSLKAQICTERQSRNR